MSIFNLTEEEWEKIAYQNYLDCKSDKNNYSYWYEKVKDCGFNIVNSYIYQIPFEQYQNSHSENKERIQEYYNYIKELIKDLPYNKYNIKNAVFSNKFNFEDCIAVNNDIPTKIHLINYAAACVGANGYTELIVRDYIDYDYDNIPTIYNGMPLRSEFRVFYDFDKKEVFYSVNYWDFDYCYKHLDITDKIVFKHERKRLEDVFNQRKEEVEELVKKHMANVDLQGKWSVDILYNELEDNYWLIDMAEAYRSAYWRKA